MVEEEGYDKDKDKDKDRDSDDSESLGEFNKTAEQRAMWKELKTQIVAKKGRAGIRGSHPRGFLC
jgi:hypothetical protein